MLWREIWNVRTVRKFVPSADAWSSAAALTACRGAHGEAAGGGVFRHLEIDGIPRAGRDRGDGGISGGRGKCLDGEGLESFLGRGQLRGELLRACHPGFRLHDVAHRLFRSHPRSAGLAPAGRIEQADLDADARAFADGVFDESPPFRGECLGLGIGGRAALAADDADERPADADAFHRLQILGDAIRADVAIHPIPITTRPGGFRRLGELRGQFVRRIRAKRRAGKQAEQGEGADGG